MAEVHFCATSNTNEKKTFTPRTTHNELHTTHYIQKSSQHKLHIINYTYTSKLRTIILPSSTITRDFFYIIDMFDSVILHDHKLNFFLKVMAQLFSRVNFGTKIRSRTSLWYKYHCDYYTQQITHHDYTTQTTQYKLLDTEIHVGYKTSTFYTPQTTKHKLHIKSNSPITTHELHSKNYTW